MQSEQSDSLIERPQEEEKSCWQLCQIFRRRERGINEYTCKHFLASRRFWMLLFASLLFIGIFLYGILGKQAQLNKKCVDMECGEKGFWDGYNCDSTDGTTCYKPYDPYNCACSQKNWCFFIKKQECLGIRFELSAIMGGIAGFLGLLVIIPISRCMFVSDRTITTAYHQNKARYLVVRIDD